MSYDDERLAQSFEKVARMHQVAARQFYTRLLEIVPEVQPRLEHELSGQGRMFVATLAMLVRGVRDVPALLLVAAGMAERYVTFGAGPEHLPQVGDALMETLASVLGESFTAETRTGWNEAYRALVDAMTDATPSAA